MNGRIVVGVDGTPVGRAAAEFAANEAERRNAGLEVMHAFKIPYPALEPTGMAYLPVDHAMLVAAARQVLDTEADRLRTRAPTVTIEASLHEGSPADMLADASRDALMVVVGTRHVNELAGYVRGSVCRHVLHRAACPVVIVPSPSSSTSRN